MLNEIADIRAGLLGRLFRDSAVTLHNAEHIHDHLDPAVRPSVVLMNPPFSASPHVEKRFAEAAWRHVAAAFARLRDGGRLVAITGHNVGPNEPGWRDGFVRLQEKGRVVFSTAIAGQAYARHGTTMDTRLTVIDRAPADDPTRFPSSPGKAATASELLDQVIRLVPPRPALAPLLAPVLGSRPGQGFPLARIAPQPRPAPKSTAAAPLLQPRVDAAPAPNFIELAYETCEWAPAERGRLSAALYEGYALQSLRIAGAQPHPTKLVQSAAMAAVAPPRPTYRPLLPPRLIEGSILSDAQLESAVYAGEAHSGHLAGSYTVDETWDQVAAAPEPAPAEAGGLKAPCVSAAAGFSAPAPAPARAARSPRSSSTTGSRGAAARCGSPNPIS